MGQKLKELTTEAELTVVKTVLPTGVYLVTVSGEFGNYTQKVVID